MLAENQVRELLLRCEENLGTTLNPLRQRLKAPKNRAAAIFELLVMETTMQLGEVQYEPLEGSSPDLCLQATGLRPIWLEVTFLHPRFSKEEDQKNSVQSWVWEMAKGKGLSPYKINLRFDGVSGDNRGPILQLPGLHEKREIIRHKKLASFFDQILRSPDQSFECNLSPYTVTVLHNPKYNGRHLSSGGLLQEAPRTIEEQAVYRKLEDKAQQHKVVGPYIVCLGSDQSPALSSLQGVATISKEQAVQAAFNKFPRLSGAIIVTIEDKLEVFARSKKEAKGELFVNPNAKYLLKEEEASLLKSLDFNRWAYWWGFSQQEVDDRQPHRHGKGDLNLRQTTMGYEIEIPEGIILDALAGKKSLMEAYNIKETDPIYKMLNSNCQIISCKLADGNIQQGEPRKITLELTTLPEIFWKKEK